MAKFTLEEIMYGEKYNIESGVFMAAYELAKQGGKSDGHTRAATRVLCKRND